MKDVSILKLENLRSHPDAQLRVMETDDAYHLRLSCHCATKIGIPDHLFKEAIFWLTALCGGKFIKLEESHWKDPHFKATSHLFCEKDPNQVLNILALVSQRKKAMMINSDPRAIPYKLGSNMLWKVMLKMIFSGPDICLVHAFQEFIVSPEDWAEMNEIQHGKYQDIFYEKKKAKKAAGLPTSVKEALQKANNKKAQSVDSQEPNVTNKPSKNKKNKKNKKKPNRGKAPNNIRKTKKPTKL
ncbi:Oidioi.mRNA.OKI2018_I69.chr2.g6836.t1.cds [Oikopleura dioica]|uniref:Oidioi.mRNA.OKI2018_I69.chr2.g6836.t1.cds n=1 Tax=Oikopleura dioica TaxID=34765 RepID=A0ABN7T931_OIKDI|nr:Oidioi.mRNA.OKI2018_I69.chr2.g6836.t1.cds [Oikopleura dioica]